MGRVTGKFKLFLFFVFMIGYAFFYIFPNLFPSSTPSFLPFLAVDHAVAFLPWTFVVYVSHYFLVLSAVLLVSDPEEFGSFARTCFLILIICGTFFLVFPTSYPRPQYPAAENFVIAFVMAVVGNLDTPNNCFPSLHVALAAGVTWCMRLRGRNTFLFYAAWSLAVFASTLTTKQHYFVDILGGVGVAGFVGFFEWAFFQRNVFRLTESLRKSPKFSTLKKN